MWSGTVSTSTNVAYPIINAATAAQLVGVCPKTHQIYLTHSHTAALYNNAVNNNSIYYQGIYYTVA